MIALGEIDFEGMIARLEASPGYQVAKAREQEEPAAREAAKARASKLDRLRAAKFPARAIEGVELIFDGTSIDSPALLRARQFIEQDVRSGKTLLVLSGGVGSGKTTAAAWAAIASGARRVAFLRSSRLEAASRYDADLRSEWEEADAIVLDDLGAEYADTKGNFLSRLDEIIDVFYGDRKVAIITTNVDLETFKQRCGGDAGRIASRIRQAGIWSECGGVDLRSTARG